MAWTWCQRFPTNLVLQAILQTVELAEKAR